MTKNENKNSNINSNSNSNNNPQCPYSAVVDQCPYKTEPICPWSNNGCGYKQKQKKTRTTGKQKQKKTRTTGKNKA